MTDDRRRGWLRRPRPAPEAALRLVCLPHAGGTPGLFRAWVPLLPPAIEPVLVCLPGRENRLGEPVPPSIPALVSDLAEAVVGAIVATLAGSGTPKLRPFRQ